MKGQRLTISKDQSFPHAMEVEQAVLGAMMLTPAATAEGLSLLTSADFYHPGHADIFQAIQEVWRFDGEVDMLTINDYLKQTDRLEAVGGVVYIAKLASEVATAAQLKYHARIIKEKADLRFLIQACSQVIQKSYAESDKAGKLSEYLLHQLLQRHVSHGSRRGYTMLEIGREVDVELAAAMANPRRWAGLNSGFFDLNEALNGLCRPELTVLGADTGIGKTRLALQIIEGVVKHETDVWNLVYSLEMSRVQLYQYWACALSGINLKKFRQGRISTDEEHRYREAQATLNTWPVLIDDSSPLTLEELYASTERYRAGRQVGLVLIDYLQLMKGPGRSENEVLEGISQGLKDYKKKFHLHTLAISQFSKEIDVKPDRLPSKAYLRGSGAISQNADNILLIYRPGAYEHLREKARKKNQLEVIDRIADIFCPKLRFSPPTKIELMWDPREARFLNPARHLEEQSNGK